MAATIRGGKAATRPVKEAFFVRVPTPDGQVGFFNASSFIGKEMPYSKPQATCAMRVEDDVVSFSMLHLTKKTAATIVTQPIAMPRGPLARLHRRALSLDVAPGEVVVELGEDLYRLTIKIDDNGLAQLEVAPGGGGGEDKDEDVTFDLPLRAVQMSLYMRSERVGRTLAVGFIGHLGKPATPETVTRAAAMVLNSMSGLVEFRLLSLIETVKVPAAPSKWSVRAPARKSEDRVFFELHLNLFNQSYEPVVAGEAVVEIDLENANPTTGRLLYHISPAEKLEEHFGDYRSIVDGAITDWLRKEMGDDLVAITYDVVLGEVDAGVIGRLRDAVRDLKMLDVTPREYRVHPAVPSAG
jgi:hypothetical protein